MSIDISNFVGYGISLEGNASENDILSVLADKFHLVNDPDYDEKDAWFSVSEIILPDKHNLIVSQAGNDSNFRYVILDADTTFYGLNKYSTEDESRFIQFIDTKQVRSNIMNDLYELFQNRGVGCEKPQWMLIGSVY